MERILTGRRAKSPDKEVERWWVRSSIRAGQLRPPPPPPTWTPPTWRLPLLTHWSTLTPTPTATKDRQPIPHCCFRPTVRRCCCWWVDLFSIGGGVVAVVAAAAVVVAAAVAAVGGGGGGAAVRRGRRRDDPAADSEPDDSEPIDPAVCNPDRWAITDLQKIKKIK